MTDQVNEAVSTPSEAVYAFGALLTTLSGSLTIGATHDASVMAQMCEAFRVANSWEPPRDNYTDYLARTSLDHLLPEAAHPSRGVVDEGMVRCGDERYELDAYIWLRESTNEWVLELSGSINDCDFTVRHTEPLTTAPEDVASLPSLQAATLPAVPDVCVWTFDDDEHAPMWTSPCGVTYSFTEGGPEDNGHKFCHSCGKPLVLATTPAEVDTECAEFVDMVGDEFGNEAGVRLRDLFATLARQLAEANSELAMHRVDATRVAACPWRVQKGHTSECQPPKRLQDALDQLAEATRRLGEVEGLVGKWLNEAVITRTEAAKLGPDELISAVSMNDQAHTQEDCAEELLTALTKEPTK